MKVLFSLIVFVFTAFTANAQYQAQPLPPRPTQSQSGVQQTSDNSLTPQQLAQQLFPQYVETFIPDARPNYVLNKFASDTVSKVIDGYMVVEFVNGTWQGKPFVSKKGDIMHRYTDNNEYYFNEDIQKFVVTTARFKAAKNAIEVADEKLADQQRVEAKAQKKDEKRAKRAARSPEEKQQRMMNTISMGMTAVQVLNSAGVRIGNNQGTYPQGSNQGGVVIAPQQTQTVNF